MVEVKTLRDREKELQALMATPEGRAKLQALARGYHTEEGTMKSTKASVITYILVYERQKGLVVD